MDVVWTLRIPLLLFFAAYIVKELWILRAHERWHAILMFSYFFLIISTYWLIKPVKKALLVGYYQVSGLTLAGWYLDAAQVELIAKELNMFLALAAAILFSWLASRYKRERLTLFITGMFALGFALFASALLNPAHITVWMFYLFGDIFVTIMVAGFFAFLNDSEDVHTARRLYGLIGLGGIMGGFFGSAVVAGYSRKIEPSTASLACVGLLVLIAGISWLFGRLVKRTTPVDLPAAASVAGYKVLQHGVKTVLCSPYLLGIAAIVGLYEMVSSIMDYQFTNTVLHFVSGDQLKAHFASVYSFTNFISLILQVFITRMVMVRYGVDKALFFLPVTATLGEAAFILLPGLLAGSLLNTMDNAFSYSINQSAKEVLYVPVEREEKYKAKALIDIFILRGAKAIAVALSLVLALVFAGFESVRWLSIIVVGLLIVWLLVIRYIGQRYRKMERGV
ncbi:MAG: hypothetical protein HZA08_10345 [Nitrospirae bacterium]|nr:hypothetical protein [Nitrospirota bacterium]